MAREARSKKFIERHSPTCMTNSKDSPTKYEVWWTAGAHSWVDHLPRRHVGTPRDNAFKRAISATNIFIPQRRLETRQMVTSILPSQTPPPGARRFFRLTKPRIMHFRHDTGYVTNLCINYGLLGSGLGAGSGAGSGVGSGSGTGSGAGSGSGSTEGSTTSSISGSGS